MKTSLFCFSLHILYFNFCLIVILIFQNVDMDIHAHIHSHKIFVISSPNVKNQQSKEDIQTGDSIRKNVQY